MSLGVSHDPPTHISSVEPNSIVLRCLTYWICCLYIKEYEDLRPSGSSFTTVQIKKDSGERWTSTDRRVTQKCTIKETRTCCENREEEYSCSYDRGLCPCKSQSRVVYLKLPCVQYCHRCVPTLRIPSLSHVGRNSYGQIRRFKYPNLLNKNFGDSVKRKGGVYNTNFRTIKV